MRPTPLTEGPRHLAFGPNPAAGRDFVAGDVHGEFAALERALERAGFDPRADRLFSVGDLVDRGRDSDAALAWLEHQRFAAVVRGNHEQMMLDALSLAHPGLIDCETLFADLDAERAQRLWRANGARWWYARERGAAEAVRRAELGEAPGDWAGGCADLRAVVAGHTPLPTAQWEHNVLNVDTGAFRPGGHLTLARIDCAPVAAAARAP